MLRDSTLAGFLDELASGAPTPGGGAAAALTVAQSAALLEMVCHLTVGKKAFAGVAEEVQGLLEQATGIRGKALALAEDDVVAFGRVMVAYKMPKGSAGEQGAQREALEVALKASSEVPFALFNLCKALFPMAERLGVIGNPQVQSDVDVALLLAEAGIEAARVNVKVNLDGIKDRNFCVVKLLRMKARKI